MKILLVEDELLLSSVISKGLRKCGYAVDCGYDGEEALDLYDVNTYDIIILDLNLPKVDGLEVLRSIRQLNAEIKIIILSARSAVEDKIKGLDFGANDYLAKPFDFFELEARIRNLLRQSFVQQRTQLSCGPVCMDTAKKLVTVHQQALELTKKEYSLLEYLLYHQDRVISAEEIIEHVWDSEVDLFSNSLKYHIHSLKKKLSAVAGDSEIIKNYRGHGYVISYAAEDVSDQ
ncbi:response regulator transcription factor [Paenibacillus sp. UMB4589-SE434]|uniref:response regulator transcription factor n=1 Tax=Paenibacillus sp. UMB4589-SE434 TaxID=3046314 RepID=UPI00255025DF|nr:response regulator transcription factor [Paenibacillus sp. UMB4589-SE434]MDK8179681.1 response regulator transcription factor [Paenibacillus sp. UMB4589-SE434]